MISSVIEVSCRSGNRSPTLTWAEGVASLRAMASPVRLVVLVLDQRSAEMSFSRVSHEVPAVLLRLK
jgi:hypothetical protein